MIIGKATILCLTLYYEVAKGNEMLVFLKARERDIVSPAVFHGETSNSLPCMSTLGKSEFSCCDIAVNVYKSQCSTGEGDGSVSLIAGDYQ